MRPKTRIRKYLIMAIAIFIIIIGKANISNAFSSNAAGIAEIQGLSNPLDALGYSLYLDKWFIDGTAGKDLYCMNHYYASPEGTYKVVYYARLEGLKATLYDESGNSKEVWNRNNGYLSYIYGDKVTTNDNSGNRGYFYSGNGYDYRPKQAATWYELDWWISEVGSQIGMNWYGGQR